ncbi:MAG: Polyketide cyclase / dehydrase and lipid transport [Actinomycetota bacterium]|jgi:hypothetical protein|nr:Polyketide cyclase / dehydrase and lipid transport [Actinomycetota bacterium]
MRQGRNLYRIQDRVTTRAEPEAVMERVLSPKTWPEWQAEIKTVEGPDRMEDGDQVSGDAELVGFKVQGRSDAHVVDEGLFIEDVIVGVRMVITYEVRPTESGSEITRTLEADLPRGFLGGILSIVLRAKLRRMQKKLLSSLAGQAEAEA